MKKRTKIGAFLCAGATLALSIPAFATNVISDIENNAGSAGELSSINKSVNKFSGNLIAFILSLVVAVILVVVAIALLKAALGGQREKEEVKGKIIWAVVLLVLATPAAFFGIAGIIGSEAEKVGTNIKNGGGGGEGDGLGSFNDAAPEKIDYSVYL